MNVIDSHREAVRWASELLEMVMADVTSEQATWTPAGLANPLGATYAHAVCSVDGIVQGILKGEAPLFATTWAGKCGISQPQLASSFDWARNLQVDLPALREYARAAYQAADDYIASLGEEDLDQERDLSAADLGTRSVNWILNALVTSHINNMAGEISVLKGLQGAKGYPF
jgi:hypothetical protein